MRSFKIGLLATTLVMASSMAMAGSTSSFSSGSRSSFSSPSTSFSKPAMPSAPAVSSGFSKPTASIPTPSVSPSASNSGFSKPAVVGGIAAGTVAAGTMASTTSQSTSTNNGFAKPGTPGVNTSTNSSSSNTGFTKPETTTPATNNGFAKPTTTANTVAPAVAPPKSVNDMKLDQKQSAAALSAFKADQDRKYTVKAEPAPVRSNPAVTNVRPYTNVTVYRTEHTRYYSGWNPPVYVYHGAPVYGVYDSNFLWKLALVDSINTANAAWFYHHRNDADYQAWRRDADRLAKDNAELRARLDALDKEVNTMQGQPVNTNYMPPGVNPALALAPTNAVKVEESTSYTFLIIMALLVVGVGTVVVIKFRNNRKYTSPTEYYTG